MRRRWLHRLYAWVARYVWLACPQCGVEFGGREEAEPLGPRMSAAFTTRILCPSCTQREGAGRE